MSQKDWFFRRWEWQDYAWLTACVLLCMFGPLVYMTWWSDSIERMRLTQVRVVGKGRYRLVFMGPLGRVEWLTDDNGLKYPATYPPVSPDCVEMTTTARTGWYEKMRNVQRLAELGQLGTEVPVEFDDMPRGVGGKT